MGLSGFGNGGLGVGTERGFCVFVSLWLYK